MPGTLESKGIAEAASLLDDLAKAIESGEIGGEQFKTIMEAALQIAISRTPVKTGRLASGNKLRFDGWNSATLYNDVPYAGFVHEGTSKMAPRPFIREATEMVRARFPDMYRQSAQEFIRQLHSKQR
ncbi:MAG: hypothetical protein QXJ74_07670 [Nitrososphaera sp.]|uniref:hypothetical protein n=1 Tax=Nitrososphaera sp. TaxID=1971748 RepID=UPI001829ED04|nr:hypothetical protein [Nitrososphaera sp.]NWG38076.1 hypothetical protein [Nitrososphaera sp.]